MVQAVLRADLQAIGAAGAMARAEHLFADQQLAGPVGEHLAGMGQQRRVNLRRCPALEAIRQPGIHALKVVQHLEDRGTLAAEQSFGDKSGRGVARPANVLVNGGPSVRR
jgi:hypothetical protein